MSTWFIVFMFVLGLVLIIKGGDWFVDAASWIAEVSGIPKFIIGATVVSLATTMPELLVSTFAAAKGSADMAVGNAVGSVTANTALILAIGMIFMPTVISRRAYLPKCLMLVGAVFFLWLGCKDGTLSRWSEIVLLVILAAFVWENLVTAKSAMKSHEDKGADKSKKTVITSIIKFVLGVAGIVIGAQLLVDYGTLLATQVLGVPEAIVAVTMVAIGTSLPELVTTITAIVKKQSALSVGNIIGANIIDLTLILPISALISGKELAIGTQSRVLDLPACMLVSLVAVVPPLLSKKFTRFQGGVLLFLYAAYLAVMILFFV